jgi:DNA-binding transcriptional LysR family regulator
MGDDAYDVMDLKALRCFWATGRHGSLTRAGIELGISEAAVSQRIRSLETYLGVKLYESRGGRVRLTPAGERTLALARGLFDQLEDFRRTVVRGAPSGVLTVSAHEPVLRYLLPDIVAQFAGEYSGVRLRLLSRTPKATLELVRQNEVDVGIIPTRTVPEDVIFHPWRTFEAYLLLPRGHPLLRRGVPQIRELLNEATARRYPLIVPEADDPESQRVAQAMRREGLPVSVALEVGSVDTVKHYVARGLGLAVVSGIGLGDADRAMFEMVEIPPEFKGATTYGVVLRKDKHLGIPLRGLLPLLGVKLGPSRGGAVGGASGAEGRR